MAVVIFTNEKFEDYEKYLSRYRWMSYVITPDKALAARKWDADLHQWVFLKQRINQGLTYYLITFKIN
jgi:hypothetical protein